MTRRQHRDPPSRPQCGRTDADFRYGAQQHVAFLRASEPWRLRILRVCSAGAATRHGLAWREVSTGDAGSDPKRFDEWNGAMRELASLLPPSLDGLVTILARDPGRLVTVPPGPAIRDPVRVRRLQATCLRRLDGQPVGASDAKHLRRALRTIDPGRPAELAVLVAPGSGVPRPTSGQPLSLSATAIAHGGPPYAHPAASGYPAAVTVATYAVNIARVHLDGPPPPDLSRRPGSEGERFTFLRDLGHAGIDGGSEG